MNAKKLSKDLGDESMYLARKCKLSVKCMIKESSNAVASGAGGKGLFLGKSLIQESVERKISQSIWDVDNGAGSKGLFSINMER